MKISISFLSGLVFTLITILQLLRLFYSWPAQIGNLAVPMWVSGLAVIIAGTLAVANFVTCHRNQ